MGETPTFSIFLHLSESYLSPRDKRKNKLQAKETTPSSNILEAAFPPPMHMLVKWANTLPWAMLSILNSSALSFPVCPRAPAYLLLSTVCKGANVPKEKTKRTMSSTLSHWLTPDTWFLWQFLHRNQQTGFTGRPWTLIKAGQGR